MKKSIFMVIVAILITGLLVAPSMAKEKGPSKEAGKSNIGHLYLYEKTGDPNWDIVPGGPWGKMKYNTSGPTFDFVFNGHGLPIGVEFELIYYSDPWATHQVICLGYGTVTGKCDCAEEPCSCGEGNVHIQGSSSEIGTIEDAKIWLVPKLNLDCDGGTFNSWPGVDAILFEGELINYEQTTE